jgi:hypothetical protein
VRRLGTSSVSPASSKSTLTSGFSARWRATTEPEEPDPQTMKSQCDFRLDLRLRWFSRTRSQNLPLIVFHYSSSSQFSWACHGFLALAISVNCMSNKELCEYLLLWSESC